MTEQAQQQVQEVLPRILFISLNAYGYLEVKTRLVLTATEVAQILTLGAQKVRWMMYRHDLPSFHIGTRRVVSLRSLENYVREREAEEQQYFLDALKRYYGYGYFSSRTPHPEIQRAEERLNAMQRQQGDTPAHEQEKVPVSLEAALYYVTVTESGRLECTPRWLLSMQETAQLLGVSRTTLWELAKEDNFPIFHLGRRVFIRVESLLAWIRAKEQPKREQLTTALASTKKEKITPTKTRDRRIP